MYKDRRKFVHALWSIQTMVLIERTLTFETKILDIAYLIQVKLMKEPDFKL